MDIQTGDFKKNITDLMQHLNILWNPDFLLFYATAHLSENVCNSQYRSWSGNDVVVKLLTCGSIGPGSSPGLATAISDIGYLLSDYD